MTHLAGTSVAESGPNGVTLADARALVDAATAWAAGQGLRMAVAVVDAGGHPVVLARMDGASILAGETVLAKARTAAWTGRPSASAVEIGKEWPHVYLSFVGATQGAIVLSMGGIPIVKDGRVIGAIGSSGGTGQQDTAVSAAALRALGYPDEF